jgi:hypothetical protein
MRGFYWGAILGLALMCVVNSARADEYRDFQKEMLRLSYTEFCSTVGKPPAVVAEALNKAMEQDPKTWLGAVLWWNKIAEKYAAAKCGDV